MPTYKYKCNYCGEMEIIHSIIDDAHIVCPDCGKSGIIRLISDIGGIIISGRQPNQFNDCKSAKYWRDKNGARHKVTSADGHSRAPTVTKQIKSPEEVTAIKKAATKAASKKRSKDSYRRFRKSVKRQHGI